VLPAPVTAGRRLMLYSWLRGFLRAFRAIAAGPQIVEQLEAINLKFNKAFNKHDGSAVGALYVANAVHVTPVGTFSGREGIEGHMTNLFQRHNPHLVLTSQPLAGVESALSLR